MLQRLLANIVCSVEAAVFDVEYAKWLDDHKFLVCELRAAVQEQLPENQLRLSVDRCLAHYDKMMNLKSTVAKWDVFHLVSGMWKTPAERCFMWIGGFRPSELTKVTHLLTKRHRCFPVTFHAVQNSCICLWKPKKHGMTEDGMLKFSRRRVE